MKLKVKDISKNYNRYSALRGVNLELEPGLYGLLGPNGAGKSTLLKIIAGILRPTAGSILLDNEPVSKLGEHYRAMLGYMPQLCTDRHGRMRGSLRSGKRSPQKNRKKHFL